jgi:CO/xanthine dehydrogenase Mo-binding subunit
LQAQLETRRANGEKVGAGLALFVEKSGLGPFDDVRIEIAEDGAVEVVTGVASLGQGVETVMAQICADALGVDYEGVRVIHGQTDRIDRGMGSFASRTTVMCGEATRLAATKLRDKILAAAAGLMQTRAEDLDLVDGEIVRKGGGASMLLATLARSLEGDLATDATFESTHMAYPYGVHIAVARVDPDTGGVALERYVVAYDVGRAVNPMLVQGQIAGGLAQGLGGALLEEFRYDEAGEPLSVTFADYLVPTAREIPDMQILITQDAPSPLNPLGLKGAGEGGTNPVGAAIASAIDEAIGIPGTTTSLPVHPQRLKALLRAE